MASYFTHVNWWVQLCFLLLQCDSNMGQKHTVELLPWLMWFSRRPLTTAARVQSQLSPCRICGELTGTGIWVSLSISVFHCQYHFQCSKLVYINAFLFLERKMGEAWKRSKNKHSFGRRGKGKSWIETEFYFCRKRPNRRVVTVALQQWIDEMINGDSQMMTDKWGSKLRVLESILIKPVAELGYSKVRVCLVPSKLTVATGGGGFLSQIVTGCWFWRHHFEQECKR
jgi:hypothetical protein